MVVACAGISSVSNVSDGLALTHDFSLRDSVCITVEVSVVVDGFIVRVELINSNAATITVEELNDLAISGCEHRCAHGRDDVYCVMHAALGTSICEGVLELFRSNSGHGDY